MTATTEYGYWNTYGVLDTPEDDITAYISGADAAWCRRVVASGALQRMSAAYREAINAALPPDVSLHGRVFYGPHHPNGRWEQYPTTPDGHLDIAAIIDTVDLPAIIERYDPDLT